MGVFDFEEDLISLIVKNCLDIKLTQLCYANPNIIYPSVFFFISFYDHNVRFYVSDLKRGEPPAP